MRAPTFFYISLQVLFKSPNNCHAFTPLFDPIFRLRCIVEFFCKRLLKPVEAAPGLKPTRFISANSAKCTRN